MALPALPDLREDLEGLREGGRSLRPRILADFLRALRTVSGLRRRLGALEDRPALKALGEALPDLSDLLDRVETLCDDQGEIQTSASPKLSSLRAEIRGLEQRIHRRLEELCARPGFTKYLQSPQPVWRHGRPALQVKPEMSRFVRGLLLDRSQSGQTVFVQPETVLPLTNRLAEARHEEEAELRRLLAELRRDLFARREDLARAFEGLSWIDLTRARAKLVLECGFHVPEVAPEGRFLLRGARHPLLLIPLWEGRVPIEEAEKAVVPLDLSLGDPFRMLVVTGPNTGGKTVALKTVGLCQAMAQAGLPIPAAEGSALPFVDGIFADIGDEQTVEQNLSTFASHLKRIQRALDRAGPGSLVLLDELGAGTDPEEGGALGIAILEHLLERGVPTLASTHLGRLKDFAYQYEGVENGAMAFDPDRFEPLYRLEIGLVGTSRALLIARRIGMDASICSRAASLLGERDPALEEMIDRLQRTRRAAEDQRRRAEEARRRAEGEVAEAELRSRELEEKERWLAEESSWLAEEEIRRARALLREPLRAFLNAPEPYGGKARGLLKLLDGLLAHTDLGKRRDEYLRGVEKGQTVYVPRLRKRCKVLGKDRRRRRLEIEVGGVRMTIPFDDVSWLQPLDS